MLRLGCIAGIVLMVAACGGSKSRSQSVWDLYDVRQPAPRAGQPLPQDNDVYYRKPDSGSIFDMD